MSTAVLAVYLLGIGWFVWRATLEAQSKAVVLAPNVEVFSAPDSAATQVFTLHEGTTVASKEIVANWVHIVLQDGRWGWLPRNSVEKI